MQLSVCSIEHLLKATPSLTEDFLRQITCKEVEFEFYYIPITEVRYAAVGGRYKQLKGNTVKNFERLFFSAPLIQLVDKGDSWVKVDNVARHSGNYKAFCRYLDMLYREHAPTHRPKKLVRFRDMKNKRTEDVIAKWVWMLATTGNPYAYFHRKRRWQSRIQFKPDFGRISKLNKKIVNIAFDLQEKKKSGVRYKKSERTVKINFLSSEFSENAKPQIDAVNDVLNYIFQKAFSRRF